MCNVSCVCVNRHPKRKGRTLDLRGGIPWLYPMATTTTFSFVLTAAVSRSLSMSGIATSERASTLYALAKHLEKIFSWRIGKRTYA